MILPLLPPLLLDYEVALYGNPVLNQPVFHGMGSPEIFSTQFFDIFCWHGKIGDQVHLLLVLCDPSYDAIGSCCSVLATDSYRMMVWCLKRPWKFLGYWDGKDLVNMAMEMIDLQEEHHWSMWYQRCFFKYLHVCNTILSWMYREHRDSRRFAWASGGFSATEALVSHGLRMDPLVQLPLGN